MAFLQLDNKISMAVDRKKNLLGIFLDLSKAFDTVGYKILISKVNKYGLQGVALKWLKNDLINREQFVSINGHTSNRLK